MLPGFVLTFSKLALKTTLSNALTQTLQVTAKRQVRRVIRRATSDHPISPIIRSIDAVLYFRNAKSETTERRQPELTTNEKRVLNLVQRQGGYVSPTKLSHPDRAAIDGLVAKRVLFPLQPRYELPEHRSRRGRRSLSSPAVGPARRDRHAPTPSSSTAIPLLRVSGGPFRITKYDMQIFREASAGDGGILALSSRYPRRPGVGADARPTIERLQRIRLGRIRKLADQGFLRAEGGGLYVLTDKARGHLTDIKRLRARLNINASDRQLVKMAGKEKVLTRETIRAHLVANPVVRDPDKALARAEKMLNRLVPAGLVERRADGSYLLTPQYRELVLSQGSRIPRRDPDRERPQPGPVVRARVLEHNLPVQSQELVRALARFHVLTRPQIVAILGPDAERQVAELVRKRLLKVQTLTVKQGGQVQALYHLTRPGARLAADLTGLDAKECLHGAYRKETRELTHDLLIFDAYRDLEARMRAAGLKVVGVRHDLLVRSQLANQRVDIADLEVTYETEEGERGTVNLEVDCGYKLSQITSKEASIPSLVWYASSPAQAAKIATLVPRERIHVISV